MKTRSLALAALCAAACSDGLVAPPAAVRSALEGLPESGPVQKTLQTVGTWAYLVSPAVRVSLEARAHLLEQPASQESPPAPADPPAPAASPALVGVYAAKDQLLVLDTSGWFSLERTDAPGAFHQLGQWTVGPGTVVLLPEEAPCGAGPRTLTLLAQDQLLDADATFTPVTGELP